MANSIHKQVHTYSPSSKPQIHLSTVYYLVLKDLIWTMCVFIAGSKVRQRFQPPTEALTVIGQTKQYSTLQNIAIFILTRKNSPLIISPL